jgi:hypothetical protein
MHNSLMCFYRNLNLGHATKARANKVVGQEGSSGVKENVKEWTFTLLRELSLWELESRGTLESLKNKCKGQNPMDWGFAIAMCGFSNSGWANWGAISCNWKLVLANIFHSKIYMLRMGWFGCSLIHWHIPNCRCKHVS